MTVPPPDDLLNAPTGYKVFFVLHERLILRLAKLAADECLTIGRACDAGEVALEHQLGLHRHYRAILGPPLSFSDCLHGVVELDLGDALLLGRFCDLEGDDARCRSEGCIGG